MSLSIRLMQVNDLPSVLRIQELCYTELVPESKLSLQSKLVASPRSCFVATRSSLVVGYLFSIPWLLSAPPLLNADHCVLPETPDGFYLHDVAVSPNERGSGTGRLLIEQFLRILGESALHRASLVAVQNSEAFWERFGFRRVSEPAALAQMLSTYGDNVAYMLRA